MQNTTEKLKDYNSPVFSKFERENDCGLSILIDRSSIPASHKRIADSYMFIKKMYGSFMVHSQITEEEKHLLEKLDFAPLEYSTANQIKDEIAFLKKWSSSQDDDMVKYADAILNIRIKELKNILSNRYVFVSNEIYTGFQTLEQYLEKISKY